MKINDVEKITGLTQKAIRLYENKGLIVVLRDVNGYRNYSEENILTLKEIKLLRSVGVPIADIKLYLCEVMSLEEVIARLKSEILKESGKNSENYRICEKISDKNNFEELKDAKLFSENEEITSKEYGDIAVGIDIGTTTISAVVYDIDNKEHLEAYTVPHNANVHSDAYSEQKTATVLDKAEKLLYHILNCYTSVVSIGITGQMHGIVYVDSEGNPVSDLINWQDGRADIVLDNGMTTCEYITHITGERISSGYGIATHCYNINNNLVPLNATGFCSIMDMFAIKICGLKKAITHTSVAASFGMFDVEKGEFKKDKLSLLGIGEEFLPCVTEENLIIGECRGIAVSVAIGDNQASFLGSVQKNSEDVLVNIGTGSQISVAGDFCKVGEELEVRPFINGKYLICGSALCGGFAYSMVEQFFKSYVSYVGITDEPQYKVINRLALEAYERGENSLEVDVSFFGKRSEPEKRGYIRNIGRQNFTPSALILGILQGMCNELYEMYEELEEKKKNVIVSGGAARKNKVLCKLIAERFGSSVFLNAFEEEAATGAALFSLIAIDRIKYEDGFSNYIKQMSL
ncbi:MAG: MerR family transcriptional regulator [Ruminococcaceae bacterium]|nr:MerR family transcriptional regulator [Oscillospiraceae bacterium]